jgi:stage II sporulation protein AB (anti-sigma F factor)
MRLVLPARSANLALARATVAAFAAQLPFTVEELEDLKVAVSEAVSNVILHAYPDGQRGDVAIEAATSGAMLEVVVEDQGAGIEDVDRAREPAYTTAPDRMGLGFVLMENFADEVEVHSVPGRGTKVTLRKSAGYRQQGGDAVSHDPDPDHPSL